MVIKRCRFCGTQIIMLKAPKNRLIPVESFAFKLDESDYNSEIHINHKKNCSKLRGIQKNGHK
jgi:hypothetical protein